MSKIDGHLQRTEAIRRREIEPLCYRLIETGRADHRDLVAALLFQAFDLMLDEVADQGATQAVFVAMADNFSRLRLDELGIPNTEEA